jgi:sugar lactone lactonase YvrE
MYLLLTIISVLLGSCGNAINELYIPYSMIRDSSSGTLYIADTVNHRVVRYLSGASSGTVVAGGNGPGVANTQLNYPIGLYLDSSSNSLVIANAAANNIVRWVLGATSWTLVLGDPNGVIGSTSTMFHYPVGVTLDQWGNIYVADTYNHRIQFFLAGTQSGTTIAGVGGIPGSNATLLNNPNTVILDDNLNLYVADGNNHRVQKFLRY